MDSSYTDHSLNSGTSGLNNPVNKTSLSQAELHEKKTFSMKFLMWIYVVSVVMIFAGLTSAMIVSMKDNIANNSWRTFALPATFTWTTILISLSSLSLFWAQTAAKKNNFAHVNYGIWITLLLGLVFLTGQYIGFTELYDLGIRFVDNSGKIGNKTPVYNVSGSFFMILTGMHGLHIFAGIIVLIFMLVKALMYRFNSENNLGLTMTGIFWHSLGLIWLYLFIFLSVVFH